MEKGTELTLPHGKKKGARGSQEGETEEFSEIKPASIQPRNTHAPSDRRVLQEWVGVRVELG